MTRARKGPSLRQRREAAARLLSGLLKSPKTRPGLIAAVASHGVTKHYVYGYLTEQIRIGRVTVLKTGPNPLYQMTEAVVIEKPEPSEFPFWLEPRVVPNGINRAVYIDGRLVQQHAIRGAP